MTQTVARLPARGSKFGSIHRLRGRLGNREMLLDGEPVRLGGDVVVAIDARTVKTFDDLLAYLARSTEVGQTVTLTLH